MLYRLQRSEEWIYRSAIALVLAFWAAHVVSLPVEITYDGLGYIDLSDVLGSPRFPADWNSLRTPLLPLSLKLAFSVFGRQAISAILVPALYALAGILLLGASVRRVAGSLAAAGTLVLVSVFPTLVAYQHCVLTESGSFFFISLTLYLLLWTPKHPWLRTAALAFALGVGFYWRQNVLALAPVVALLLGFGLWHEFRAPLREFRRTHHIAGLFPLWPLAAHMLAVVLVSFLLTLPWSPYQQSAAIRDIGLEIGMLRQSLLPPEHPFVGPYRDDYYRAIRSSIYHRNYLSGMRWDLMSDLAQKIWTRPAPKPIPQFFWELVKQNPGRYLNGFGRTLLFYAGVRGGESDNRIFRDEVLSETLQGSKISVGPEPLRSRIQHDFEQRTTSSVIMRFVRGLIPVYEPLLILASVLTVLGLATSILLRDVRLLAFCAIPSAYALSYAVLLMSLDRFMVPVYPLSLANAILVPLALYRRFGNKGQTAAARILPAPADMPPPATTLAHRAPILADLPLPRVDLPTVPVERVGIQEGVGAGTNPPDSVRRWTPTLIVLLLLPVHMIVALFQLHHRIPWGDLVNLFCATELYDGLTWSSLGAFSNEHRVAFTRLVVFFDYTVLHGANLAPYVAAAVLGLLPPVVCYLAFRRLAPCLLTRGQALVVASLMMAVYFNGNQTITLFDPIMLQHYFVNAFALAAAWALSVLLFGNVRHAGLAAAALFGAGLCGSFSSATGILIVPAAGMASVIVLAVGGWKALAARWKTMGFLMLASVAIALGYVVPYLSTGRLVSRTPHAPPTLLHCAHFVLLFVGAPFWRETTWPLAHHSPLWLVTCASLAFVAVAGWVAVQVFRRRASLGRFEAFHLAIIFFVLTTAILGSLYRGSDDVTQAFNKRYAVTQLLFWLSTMSLGISYRPRILFGRDGVRSLRVLFISAVVVTALLPLHLSEIHTWLWLKDRLSETAATVGSGMFDYVRVKRLYYDDGEGYQLMGIFRNQRVYFLPQYPLPPYPLDSHYRVRGRSRPGLTGSPQLLEEYPGRSGYIIVGSMPPGAVAAGPLVVTDAADNVVGYGHVSRVPERWAPFGKPDSWFAAFRNPYASPSIKIYAARGSDAYELARIAVPAKSTGPLPAPSGCLIAGVSDIFLENMNDVTDPITGTPVVISQPAPILLRGWAVDRSANLPTPDVKAFLDDNPHSLSYGYPSPDIATFFKNPTYARSGFRMDLPTTGLAKGKHSLFFRVSTRRPPGCRQSGMYLFTLK